MRSLHIPLRSCVICRQRLDKRELVRIVRTPEGETGVDSTGKRSGRGAYLCRKPHCWEQALKKSRLDYALRGRLTTKERQNLEEYARSLTTKSISKN